MKVGILTFHCAANYGAVLQAYALQEVIKAMGHEVYLIDYRPDFLLNPYRAFNLPNPLIKPIKFARSLLIAPIRIKRLHNFKQFIANNFKLINLSQVNQLDLIVIGSDQVWNPGLNNDKFDTTYLLDFPISPEVKKITYAASAGSAAAFQQKLDDKIIELIKKFDAVSVRELSLHTVLHNAIPEINPTVDLDPVLLAEGDIFDKLTNKKLVPEEPYILSFSLGYSPKISAIAKQMAEEKGIKLVEMVSADDSLTMPSLIQTAKIDKFLSLIKYAEGIVTSSFHGTALSIIFNRPFISVGYSESHSERIRSLLDAINLQECFYILGSNAKPHFHKIDYPRTGTELKTLKNKSYITVSKSITHNISNNN